MTGHGIWEQFRLGETWAIGDGKVHTQGERKDGCICVMRMCVWMDGWLAG